MEEFDIKSNKLSCLQVLFCLLLLLHAGRHLRHGAADGVEVGQLGQVLQVVNAERLGRVQRPRPEVELGRHGGGAGLARSVGVTWSDSRLGSFWREI